MMISISLTTEITCLLSPMRQIQYIVRRAGPYTLIQISVINLLKPSSQLLMLRRIAPSPLSMMKQQMISSKTLLEAKSIG